MLLISCIKYIVGLCFSLDHHNYDFIIYRDRTFCKNNLPHLYSYMVPLAEKCSGSITTFYPSLITMGSNVGGWVTF